MSDELIIQQLKDKETQLLNDLEKVRLALNAFIAGNINFSDGLKHTEMEPAEIPATFDCGFTYGVKIMYVLSKEARPLLVDEIVEKLHQLEPGLNIDKLHKNVSYNLSMLAKYQKIKKHPFNRKIKYSM